METKNRKILVFWVIQITFALIFAAIILRAPDQLSGISGTLIWAMVGNGATFIGGNVFDAWQRSKYYRPELAPASVAVDAIAINPGAST